jgi:hypothetical protein
MKQIIKSGKKVIIPALTLTIIFNVGYKIAKYALTHDTQKTELKNDHHKNTDKD